MFACILDQAGRPFRRVTLFGLTFSFPGGRGEEEVRFIAMMPLLFKTLAVKPLTCVIGVRGSTLGLGIGSY